MKAIVKRLRRKQTNPSRILGKSALQRNREDRAFGRDEQRRRRQRPLQHKHRRRVLLKLKLHDQLRTTNPPKKPGPKLHRRITEAKPSQASRKISPKRNHVVALVPDACRLPEMPCNSGPHHFSRRCQTPFQSFPGGFRRRNWIRSRRIREGPSLGRI